MYSKLLINNFSSIYGESRIICGLNYQLSVLSKIDYNIIFIVNDLNKNLNIKYGKNYNLKNILLCMIYYFNSIVIIFNLPHMLNLIKYNNKPSLHIIFGETITQLTSISLLSECLRLITAEPIMKIKNKNIMSFNKLNYNKMILENLYNEIDLEKNLKVLLKDMEKEIYRVAIELCLNYYEISIKDLDNNILDNLKEFI